MTTLTETEQADIMFALEELAEVYEGHASLSRDDAASNASHGHHEAAAGHEASAADHQATADRLWALAERVTNATRIYLEEVAS